MSIIIQNVSEDCGVKYGEGAQHYVLRINQKRIAYFTHDYEKGPAECLRRAAEAAEDPNRVEVQDDNEVLMATFAAIEQLKG